MTAALYLNMDDHNVTLEQLEESCCEAGSTLAGALLIVRTFIRESDNDELVHLCEALKVLLDNAKCHIEDILPAPTQPISLTASLPDVATAHTGG